jgi:hypothetical protein
MILALKSNILRAKALQVFGSQQPNSKGFAKTAFIEIIEKVYYFLPTITSCGGRVIPTFRNLSLSSRILSLK